MSFVGMVLPADELTFKLKHVGQRGEKVVNGTACVAQDPTVNVFNGQGPHGRGLDLYNAYRSRYSGWCT